MNRSLFLLCVLALYPSLSLAGRKYKYSLNPDRAEEILAGIVLNEPMPESKWLSLLGSKRDEKYTVREGDTLWSVSKKMVGDPFLWRKMWSMNPDVGNPHEINVGQNLSYYRSDLPGGFQIPLVKLVPSRPGTSSDLDSDSYVNLEVKNQYRPGIFLLPESEFLGQVTGSYFSGKWLVQHEDLFIKFKDPSEAVVGKSFSIVRVGSAVTDKFTSGSPALGTLTRLLAEVKVIRTKDGLSKVSVVRQLGAIERGDRVIALREPVKPSEILEPPVDAVLRVLQGELSEANQMGQGQIVLLNKGVKDGMRAGYLFRVAVDQEPFLKSSTEVLPDYKAEIQLIAVNEMASIGLILRNVAPVVPGDTLVASQLFPNPPPHPVRTVEEVEFE